MSSAPDPTGLRVGEKITVNLYRFDPTKDQKPHYETYEVPYEKYMRVLDALIYINQELGVSFDYQWSCGGWRCGSSAFTVNGKPLLGCWEPVEKKMTIEPLRNYPVVKDLVIDRTKYDQWLVDLKAYLVRGEPHPAFPEPLRHEDMANLDSLRCIECGICTSECRVANENPNYAGPAALVQFARFALDPRDGLDRKDLAVKAGLDLCTQCRGCELYCPKDIPIHELLDKMRKKYGMG